MKSIRIMRMKKLKKFLLKKFQEAVKDKERKGGNMNKKIIFKLLIGAAAAFFFILLGINNHLNVVQYQIQDERIKGNMKIAFISDYHSEDYGEKQEKLLKALEEEHPDAVFLGGDIFDDKKPYENVLELLEGLKGNYETYFVTGNHEFRLENTDEIKEVVKSYGIHVLAGETVPLIRENLGVDISGIDDEDAGYEGFYQQFEKAEETRREEAYSILLSHRPEYFDYYAGKGYNLVLSGHTHGGIWRIPKISNGFLSSERKYMGGKYQIENSNLIVGRGLAKWTGVLFRLYNPPELVVVLLEGKD